MGFRAEKHRTKLDLGGTATLLVIGLQSTKPYTARNLIERISFPCEREDIMMRYE